MLKPPSLTLGVEEEYQIINPETRNLESAIDRILEEDLGPSFKPAQVRFTRALPKTRSAKVLRRAIRSVVTGDAPGDLSSLEDPAALDAIAAAS